MVPGDILLIPRGVAHWIRRAEGDCYMVSFHMHTRAYGAIDALSLLQLGGVHVSPDREFVLRTVTHLAHEYAVRPLGWRRSMRAGMEQIVLEVLRDGGYTRPGHESPHFSPEIVGVCPALEVIESRLHDPTLRVSDIAAVMHMSEPALRARFRAVFGTSPVTIIRRERVARACILLRSTGDPVARIAEQCGFSDVPFFYRAFKSVMRTTPACYRDGRSMP
jgi:AraC-like DNA-binding protein